MWQAAARVRQRRSQGHGRREAGRVGRPQGLAEGPAQGSARPDAERACRQLADRGLHVGRWAVWKFCRDETLSVKKSILPSEQDRPCLVRRRALWRRLAAVVSRKRLVFVDGREQAPPVRAPRPTGPGPT